MMYLTSFWASFSMLWQNARYRSAILFLLFLVNRAYFERIELKALMNIKVSSGTLLPRRLIIS